MSFLIVLHSPAVGYCPDSETYFVGTHEGDSSPCHDACEHQDPQPCQDQHILMVVDAGEFQWSTPSIWVAPQLMEIAIPEWLFVDLDQEASSGWLSRVSPPPPDVPIYRRDATLRL